MSSILRNRKKQPSPKSIAWLEKATRSVLTLLALGYSTSLKAQTAPTPLVLPVSQNFGTTTFTTLPSGFAAWGGLSGNSVNTQALAQSSSPSADATLAAATATQTTGAAYGFASGGDAKFYVQTSSNGTNGVNQLAMGLNTSGRQDVVIGYTVDIVSAQPRTVGVVCQYRVGTSGAWTTVTPTSGSNPYSQAAGTVGLKTTVSATLPAAANNQSVVQIRWACWRGTEAGNSSGFAIDNITATSSPLGGSDTTPPTLALSSPFSPTDNSTGVSIGTSLSVTFSESIAAGTGAITLYKQSDDSVVQTFTVGTSAVTISGATASFTPTTPLLNNTDYYVLIPSGVIKDVATVPNNFAGISDKTVWNFKTIPADITPPSIVSVTPVTGSSNIAPPTSLTVTFSENVQSAIFGTPKIYLKKVVDDSTVAVIDADLFGPVTISGAVATIPIPPLDYAVGYYVTIDAGAFEDVSSSNNPFAGLTKFSDSPTNTVLSWTFTTVDVPGLATSYTQTFAGLTTATPTLPSGWSTSGGAGFVTTYRGDWGTTTPDPVNAGATLGGIKGNASVFGYHHTSSSGTTFNTTTLVGTPLSQILTLRNTTGATLDNLTVAYKGRTSIPANTRLPAYTVSINGSPVSALSYSTTDPDNTQRNVALTGLGIANGATFQIVWSSFYPSGGSGSARQIGISDVVVNVGTGTETYPPSISGPLIPVLTTGSTTVEVQSNVISDGGSAVITRGYVYSVTSLNGAPEIGGANVSQWTAPTATVGALNGTLTGLTPEVNYTVRGYATNANGTTYTGAITFTTLGLPPSLTLTPYNQLFTGFSSTLVFPAGWTALSDAIPPVQAYGSDWNSTSSNGGFSGNVSPGVLGYRHTGSTGNLTVTLRMLNGTASPLTSLYVNYQGRVSDTAQTRFPAWAVSVNGIAAPALAYSTGPGVDTMVGGTISGLNIAPGAEFTITWTSNRGTNAQGSSRKIGISNVTVGIPSAPILASASASSITSTTATLNGSVTADGYLPITERGFVYAPTSTNSNPLIDGTGVIKEVDGAVTTGALAKALTGLTASTGYSFKAYAINSLGTTYSTVATFSTTAPGLSYDTWNDAIANQAANLDFDGDGISNGVEFFMGTAGNAFTPNPGIVAGVVTWPREAGTLITSFKVEVSTNLSTWENATVNYNANLNITGSAVSFTMPTTPGAFFVRLSVTP